MKTFAITGPAFIINKINLSFSYGLVFYCSVPVLMLWKLVVIHLMEVILF